jgi:hypothetical protein
MRLSYHNSNDIGQTSEELYSSEECLHKEYQIA